MSSTALQTLTGKLAARFDMGDGAALIETLKATAFKGDVSDAQMTALMVVANQYGLNPWTREIYAFPDKQNGIVPVVGVDGWSRIMNEHPQFDGLEFVQDAESCTCIIYRKDRSHPIKATEWMEECYRPAYKNREGREVRGPWQSHPKRMLRHKAMIQAARLAFGFVGIFDQDEAERIIEIDVTPAKQTGAEAAIAARSSGVKDTPERAKLIERLTQATEFGIQAYTEEWAAIGREGRVLVGAEEHAKLKALASKGSEVVDNETGEILKDDHNA